MRYHFGPSYPPASSDGPSEIWRRSGFHRYPTKSTETWPSAASSIPHSRPRCCMETLDGELPPTDPLDSSETKSNCFQRNCTRDATVWLRWKVEVLQNLISPVYMKCVKMTMPVCVNTSFGYKQHSINARALSERSCWKKAPQACCIHFHDKNRETFHSRLGIVNISEKEKLH